MPSTAWFRAATGIVSDAAKEEGATVALAMATKARRKREGRVKHMLSLERVRWV
jgi:hypothetical protein